MKTDTANFLETLLFVADSPDHETRPFRDSTIHDFHPDFIAAVDSFIAGFREYLARMDEAATDSDVYADPDAGERSFGGNVFFSLSGHGCGFWDDCSNWGRAMDSALKAYSASLPGGERFGGAYRFEELEYTLSKHRGGKIDLAYLAKYLPAYRRRMFGQPEPTVAVFRTFRKTGEVIALFPEIPGDIHPCHCQSYMHVGQHGAAYTQPRNTRPATPEEIAPLKAEIERIGYTLEVRRRVTAAMDEKRRASLIR